MVGKVFDVAGLFGLDANRTAVAFVTESHLLPASTNLKRQCKNLHESNVPAWVAPDSSGVSMPRECKALPSTKLQMKSLMHHFSGSAKIVSGL